MQIKVSRLDVTLMLELNQGIYSCVSENKAGSAYKNFTVIVHNGLGNVMHPLDVSSEESGEQESLGTNFTSLLDEKHQEEEMMITHSSSSDLIFGAFAGLFIVITIFLTVIVFVVRKKKIISRQRTRRSPIFRISSSSHRNLDWESELEKLHPFSLTSETTETVVSDDDDHVKGKGVKDGGGKYAERSQAGIGSGNIVNPLEKPPRLAFTETRGKKERGVSFTHFLLKDVE